MTFNIGQAWLKVTGNGKNAENIKNGNTIRHSSLSYIHFIAIKTESIKNHVVFSEFRHFSHVHYKRTGVHNTTLVMPINWPNLKIKNSSKNFNPLITTLKPQSNGPSNSNSDWYTGRWWVGCHIRYSEEGTGRAHNPPRPLLTVLNVSVHASTAIVPTLY